MEKKILWQDVILLVIKIWWCEKTAYIDIWDYQGEKSVVERLWVIGL